MENIKELLQKRSQGGSSDKKFLPSNQRSAHQKKPSLYSVKRSNLFVPTESGSARRKETQRRQKEERCTSAQTVSTGSDPLAGSFSTRRGCRVLHKLDASGHAGTSGRYRSPRWRLINQAVDRGEIRISRPRYKP